MVQLKKYDREHLITELKFETSRSGGKGGQHVNKTESRVTLVFNVRASHILSFAQKERIERNLSNRISSGELRLSADSNRSQHRNKEEVIKRFFNLLETALKEQAKRVPTKIPKSKNEARLKYKKEHGQKKEMRKKVRKNDY